MIEPNRNVYWQFPAFNVVRLAIKFFKNRAFLECTSEFTWKQSLTKRTAQVGRAALHHITKKGYSKEEYWSNAFTIKGKKNGTKRVAVFILSDESTSKTVYTQQHFLWRSGQVRRMHKSTSNLNLNTETANGMKKRQRPVDDDCDDMESGLWIIIVFYSSKFNSIGSLLCESANSSSNLNGEKRLDFRILWWTFVELSSFHFVCRREIRLKYVETNIYM